MGQPYLESEEEIDALRSLRLESAYRGMPVERSISRLRTERSLFDGGHLNIGNAEPLALVVVIVERQADAALASTLASIALQSCPLVRCLVTVAPGVESDPLRDFLATVTVKPTDLHFHENLAGRQRDLLRQAQYVIFLRHGDQLHPAAATWLAIQTARDQPPDVVTWGELQPDEAGTLAWARRNPGLQRETLLHVSYPGNAFAVASRIVADYHGNIVDECLRNALHIFQIWAMHAGAATWIDHPEYFLIRSKDRVGEELDRVTRNSYEAFAPAYESLFREFAPNLTLNRPPSESAAPYQLLPQQRPDLTSVIILFRDKADITLRAVQSVARQQVSGSLEIILVNNQSSPHALAQLRAGLKGMDDGISWRIVDFDRPFNHSQQCNEAVAASQGEIIVLLNNDCELIAPAAIEEMAAWAMQPGVATVGLAVENPEKGDVTAGMELRIAPTHHFDSIVEEQASSHIIPFVRECFGNTFACAAISRRTYLDAGGLDSVQFPNGFNDVEFACRTRAGGLRHLVLGHLRARHAPGQSRMQTDEVGQKVLIRRLYPQFAGAAVDTLAYDDALTELSARIARREAGRIEPATRIRTGSFLERLAASRFSQRILANPAAYTAIRKVYLVLRGQR